MGLLDLAGPRKIVSLTFRKGLNIRAPNISIIGDSITSDFYVSSFSNMFRMMWGKKECNWFLDSNPSNKIKSIFERLNRKIPVIFTQHSTPGSSMGVHRSLLDRIINRKSMATQVNEVIENKFPDLLLIWAGHSDLDWANERKNKFIGKNTDAYLKRLTNNFRNKFDKQLDRLYSTAVKQDIQTTMVIYGFINLKSLFSLREEVAKKNPSKYPYFNKTYQVFKSLRPEYKKETVKLVDMMSKELENIVKKYKKKAKYTKIRLVYSDVFHKADKYDISCLSKSDCWHISINGQRRLAELAYPEIKKELKLLGFKL